MAKKKSEVPIMFESLMDEGAGKIIVGIGRGQFRDELAAILTKACHWAFDAGMASVKKKRSTKFSKK